MNIERQFGGEYGNEIEFLRPELREIFNRANEIQRYQKLGLTPRFIKNETVRSHILRLLPMVDKFMDDPTETYQCKEILVLHDLPEVRRAINLGEGSDTTAVEKGTSLAIANKVDSEEMEVARNIFNGREFILYQKFSEAGDFLKGNGQKMPDRLALVAKMLDEVDGSVHFHSLAFDGRFSGQKLTEGAQIRAFERYKKISHTLNWLKGTELDETEILSRRILNDAMLTIKEIWIRDYRRNIDSNRKIGEIPVLIEKGLNEFVLRE